MIEKVATTWERFSSLVETIGAKHKTGNIDATKDLDRLEELLDQAFGFFNLGRIQLRHILTESISYGEDREARLRQIEEEQQNQERKSSEARLKVNAIAHKYGQQDVFLSETSSEMLSSELIELYKSEVFL